MKIGLLQGNGSDLVGGGSIQLEYNLWANDQKDITLTNLIYSKTNNRYKEKEYNGRLLTNIEEFNEKTEVTLFNKFDKLIILTYPFLSGNKNKDKELAEWYTKLLTERKRCGLWSGVICYDYKKEVVLANLGAHYPDLYRLVDVIWVNNKKNPLIDYLEEIDSRATLLIECPQFMNDTKLDWLPVNEKYKEQMYYQGRSLDWKGWKDIIPLKFKLDKEREFMNMTFNGITERPKTHYPYVLNRKFNQLAKDSFSKELLEEIRLYGLYSPADANELTKQAMFGVYFTTLDPRENFLPEYTFIDFIRNGTILIVPDWYFDGNLHPLRVNYKLIDKNPEDVGMLTWNPNDLLSTKKLAHQINELKNNEALYDEYREKAFKYMINNHGANHVIRKFLNLR